jgi:hypothetical protein
VVKASCESIVDIINNVRRQTAGGSAVGRVQRGDAAVSGTGAGD